MTKKYLDMSGLGARLARPVSRYAVVKWRARYPAESDHPFPEPCVLVGDAPGWAEDRLPEIETWRAGLPGQGAGGGRRAAAQPE